jgi:UDP-3-O-[3-hydroxymyristoyl] glucosamine N-acyltransferase
MTEPIFFKPSDGLSVGEIAALTSAQPRARSGLERRINNIAALESAGPNDLTYIDNAKFLDDLRSTHAGACLLSEPFEGHAPSYVMVLRVRDPYLAFCLVAKSLFPDTMRPSTLFGAIDVAPGAIVHASARIENGVSVDPSAVVGPRAEIGRGSVISAGAQIGREVRIGRECMVGAGATVGHAIVGDGVLIHAGCRIGQAGNRYMAGSRVHENIPQLGRVIIQDQVEIGANTTIDRGNLGDTVIGEGTKIDNLVQISHNVAVGRHCILRAQVGVFSGARIGDHAVLGAKAGVADDVIIGEGAEIAPGSFVFLDVPPAIHADIARNSSKGRADEGEKE